jgi:hypothetical protein
MITITYTITIAVITIAIITIAIITIVIITIAIIAITIITIAIITIAIIAITIITIAIITIAIITISPGTDVQTYAHNPWEATCRVCWKISVPDHLSPRSNCLPFLPNLRLQLSRPWLSGIVRSRSGGGAKDKVKTMISTDFMMSATATRLPSPFTRLQLPASRFPPSASRHPPPASLCLARVTKHVSGSTMQEHIREE